MSKYKAVFFDRDNTLTYKNENILKQYYKMVECVSKKTYNESKEYMFDVFKQIKEKGFNTNSYQNEILFYKEYYKQVLINECGFYNDKIEETSKRIFDIMWLNDRCLFKDVIPTFKELKRKGLKIGIISDTTYSLEYTLKALGVGDYIDCYTSSKEVGAMKPNPKIYLTALNKLNVKPNECLYIDDYEEEVVGAEKIGIKSFRIRRNDSLELSHDINSLKEVLSYIKE